MAMSDSNSTSREESSQSPPTSTPKPNPISCVDCRRRKIKCNKIYPCTNCEKSQLRCVFPVSRRLARGDSQELIAKIYRLESIIDSLRLALCKKDDQLNEHRRQCRCQSNGDLAEKLKRDISPLFGPDPPDMECIEVASGKQNMRLTPPDSIIQFDALQTLPPHASTSGKLIKDEGRSVYISDSFWTALITKVDDLGLDHPDSSDDEENMTLGASCVGTALQNFPLAASHPTLTIDIHPSPSDRQKLWEIFKENIDPVVKILHLPTIEPQVLTCISKRKTDDIPRNLNALLFAIYFASVSSMEDDECLEIFGDERRSLMERYRTSEEQALASAGFLNTDDLLVMQSLVLYITTLRHSAPRLSWTLSALAFRILQSLGAYCDGASLSIPILESEMRKRLSWYLFTLETGAADDFGCDPTMFEASRFNMTLPLNLNDGDLSDSTTTKPEDRKEWTDSTLLVLWADNCTLWRLIYDRRRHPEGISKPLDEMTMTEKQAFIEDLTQKWSELYIKPCSPLVPIQWVTSTVARLLILEFKLAIFKPHENPNLTQQESNELFIEAVEAIELCNKISKDRRGIRWAWLMKTFISWRTLAHVLIELTSNPLRKDHERAWSAAEQVMVTRWNSPHSRLGHQWRSMLNLLSLAREARSKELRHRRESFRSSSDAIHPILQDTIMLDKLGAGVFGNGTLTTPRQTPGTLLEDAAPPKAPAFFASDLGNMSNLSGNLCLESLPDDMINMEGLGDFDFESDVIDIDTSDHALFQAFLQARDGFQMETG